MKKNNKKGFTLVELLVVIAILAILATVSVVGYSSFTKQAKKSNAEQEMSQLKTILLADWLDGYVGEAKDERAIVKDDEGYKIDVQYLTTSSEGNKAIVTALNQILEDNEDDLNGLEDNVFFDFKAVETAASPNAEGSTILTTVKYVQGNGYTAKWNLADDSITSAETVDNDKKNLEATAEVADD